MENKCLDWTDVLTFGKYKSHSIEWVFTKEVGYLWWAINNVPQFKVFPHVELAIVAEIDKQCSLLNNDRYYDDTGWNDYDYYKE